MKNIKNKPLSRFQKWWKKNKKQYNKKRQINYQVNKEEINLKRREKYNRQDLVVINDERRKKYGVNIDYNVDDAVNNKKEISWVNNNVKKALQRLPNQSLLTKIWDYLLNRPTKKGESKKNLHTCLFLLGWKVGLRVSESISFDLNLEHQEPQFKNLYLLRGKRNKERWVYISEEVINELKKRNWKPNRTNRGSFFDFCKTLKKEMYIDSNIELSPHTLRRCFATYQSINGMPLPVLQKILGHSKVSTTAIYIKDTDLENLVKFKPV